MSAPPDNSDTSILMLADLYEDDGKPEIAGEIRDGVCEPEANRWAYEYRRCGGVGGISIDDVGVGVGGTGVGGVGVGGVGVSGWVIEIPWAHEIPMTK